jgi:predicted nucleic-acid-binding protein
MPSETVFLDTNVFLRYLTNDLPPQADAAEALLLEAEAGELKLITSSLVVAEIVWTLSSYYRLSKEDIRQKILAILNTPGLEVEEARLILQAVNWYVEKNVDFLDAYNASWLEDKGLETVYTFDQKHFQRFENLKVRVPRIATH